MRRERFTFIDVDSDQERKAFCQKCLNMQGIYNRLVPLFRNGIRDDKFRQCSFCGALEPIHDIKYFSEYEPKGYIQDNPFDSGTEIKTVNETRTQKKKTSKRQTDNEIEVPKFAGKKDTFLEELLNEGAIINSISDSTNE